MLKKVIHILLRANGRVNTNKCGFSGTIVFCTNWEGRN